MISIESEDADGLRKHSESFRPMRLDSGDLVSFLDFCCQLWHRKCCKLFVLVVVVVIVFHFTLFSIFYHFAVLPAPWSFPFVSFRSWWDCRHHRFATEHLHDAKGSISSMDRQEESLLRTALAAWKESRPQLGGVTQMLHHSTTRVSLPNIHSEVPSRTILHFMWWIYVTCDPFVYLATSSSINLARPDCQTVRAALGKKTVLLPKLFLVMLVTVVMLQYEVYISVHSRRRRRWIWARNWGFMEGVWWLERILSWLVLDEL